VYGSVQLPVSGSGVSEVLPWSQGQLSLTAHAPGEPMTHPAKLTEQWRYAVLGRRVQGRQLVAHLCIAGFDALGGVLRREPVLLTGA
jgi:hypothetical protein